MQILKDSYIYYSYTVCTKETIPQQFLILSSRQVQYLISHFRSFLTVKSFVQCLLSSDKVSNVHKRNYSQCLFIEGQYHKQTFKLINLTYEGQLYGKFKTLVSLLINETIKCCSLQENEVLNLPTVTASYFNSQLSISDHPYIFLF